MINYVWGLKQLWLQVNGHAWFHLLGLHRPVRKGNTRKIQNENMSPPGIEPATLWFPAPHLDRLAIQTVDYLFFFKLLQYSEVTGNAWASPNTLQCRFCLKFCCNTYINIDVCETLMPPSPTWPLTLNLQINRDHLLIKDYLPTKFEASGAKPSWVISCTRLRATDIPTDRQVQRNMPLLFQRGA